MFFIHVEHIVVVMCNCFVHIRGGAFLEHQGATELTLVYLNNPIRQNMRSLFNVCMFAYAYMISQSKLLSTECVTL